MKRKSNSGGFFNSKYIGWFLGCIVIILIIYLIHCQRQEYFAMARNDPVLHTLVERYKKFFKQQKRWTGALSVLNPNHANPGPRRRINDLEYYVGNKSYTINKAKVHLCMKDENGEYYDMNMLAYVLAHELSHVICESVGHTDEFHAIFDQLLDELHESRIYDKTKEILSDYCGHGTDDDE